MFALLFFLSVAIWTNRVSCCVDFDSDCALVDEIRNSAHSSLADDFCNCCVKDYCPVACNNCNADESIVMLIGGRTTNNRKNMKPWFLSLNPTLVPLPACLTGSKTNIDNLARHRAPLIIGQDGRPLMCGGAANNRECHSYETSTDSWTSQGDLMVGEGFNRGWDFTPGAGLIVAGSSKPHSKDVERSEDRGQTFTSLPNLPYGQNQGHAMVCVAIIDDNTVFIAGGLFWENGRQPLPTDTYDDTYFLDLSTTPPQYTAGPKMQVPRTRHTCHYVKATNEIVIVGGQNFYLNATCNDELYKSVEIIDLDTNTIRYGNELPFRMYRQSFLRYQDSFLVLGGKTCPESACIDGCSCDRSQYAQEDHILMYNVHDDSWTELNVTLPADFDLHSSMFLEDPYC